ncbi:MAG: hypothetical protein EOM24_29925, partial [Chloroflexia bacterium]|nr:hypothetical protein [Chloroflexia bacterium]
MLARLERLKPRLLGTLMSSAGYARMIRVTSILPHEFSQFWGFECRLDESTTNADILFSIAKQSVGAHLLAGSCASSLDPLCHVWPVWRGLRTLARHWLSPGHHECHFIKNLWLEHDIAETEGDAELLRAIHQPNVFFGPEVTAKADDICRVTRMLTRFFAHGCSNVSALGPFLATLPRGSRLFQVGLMLGRDADQGLRLCIHGVLTDELRSWLGAILPGRARASIALLDGLAQHCRSLAFDFNLTEDGVAGTFAVECYQHRTVNDPADWLALINHLNASDDGLVKRWQAVSDYVGVEAAPVTERLRGDRIQLNTIRRINHLKCILMDGA